MNKFSYLLFVIILLFTCGGNSRNPVSSGEVNTGCRDTESHCHIEPLRVGNYWTYEAIFYDSLGGVTSKDTSVIEITKDTLIDNEKWYWIPHQMWYTNRSDGLWGFQYTPSNQEMVTRYPIDSSNPAFITLDTTIVICKKRFYCYLYSYITEVTGWETFVFMAPGVGRVRSLRYYFLPDSSSYLRIEENLIDYNIR